MGFIKICSFCGSINKAEKRAELKKCQNKNCGRSLEHIASMTEEEYEEWTRRTEQSQEMIRTEDDSDDMNNIHESEDKADEAARFYLVNERNDIRFEIPLGKSVIGREHVGKKELKNLLSVSRSHLEVENNGVFLIIKDISSFGTCLDGSLILKGEEQYAMEGSIISLHIYDFQVVKERGKNDADK